MDLSYLLYDTVPLGTAANTEFVLFQVPQGGDSTHVESFTNMRGAGSLSQSEKFVINKLSVATDFVFTLLSDYMQAFSNSFLELRIQDLTYFKAPLQLLVDASAYGGSIQLSSAANQSPIGLLGDGYELTLPVTIPGGTPFRVRVYQTVAQSAGPHNLKVSLHGTLTIA